MTWYLWDYLFLLQSLTIFNNEYEQRGRREGFSTSGVAYNLYDALWLFALALNDTDAMVKSGDICGTGCEGITGSLVPLEEFTYTNGRMGCVIQWNIWQTNFFGLTVSEQSLCACSLYLLACSTVHGTPLLWIPLRPHAEQPPKYGYPFNQEA